MLYRKGIHNRSADTVLDVSASMIYCTVTRESYRCLDGTTIAKNVQQGQALKGDRRIATSMRDGNARLPS